jgi:hypothetical protein
MEEPSSRIRPILVRKLQKQLRPPKSWKAIAKACHVHLKTIPRWLRGERVRRDNIRLLANALGVSAEEIVLLDGEEDVTDYVPFEMIAGPSSASPADTKNVLTIFENAQKAIGPRYRLYLTYVGQGSIKLRMLVHVSDALRTTVAFLRGRLTPLHIMSVSMLASPDQVSYSFLTLRYVTYLNPIASHYPIN